MDLEKSSLQGGAHFLRSTEAYVHILVAKSEPMKKMRSDIDEGMRKLEASCERVQFSQLESIINAQMITANASDNGLTKMNADSLKKSGEPRENDSVGGALIANSLGMVQETPLIEGAWSKPGTGDLTSGSREVTKHLLFVENASPLAKRVQMSQTLSSGRVVAAAAGKDSDHNPEANISSSALPNLKARPRRTSQKSSKISADVPQTLTKPAKTAEETLKNPAKSRNRGSKALGSLNKENDKPPPNTTKQPAAKVTASSKETPKISVAKEKVGGKSKKTSFSGSVVDDMYGEDAMEMNETETLMKRFGAH
ncbi:hypothetical protein EV356DRAFT_570036 [Viridothelium virens]|uniref:Uncharacterized protein n=1 Tax=Viridothelium virens TaxID=1048519 RepID=A0A6A6GZ13_VIRVR|nr:hypothetical protein EV356DRAFT_570036 [Viridothelium virens]